MQLLDPIGASFSLLSTFFFTRANYLAWPFGLVACIINFVLHFSVGLYGDMALEAVYCYLMIYGWYYWYKTEETETDFTVSNLQAKQWLMLLVFAGISIPLLSYVLQHYAHSTVPRLDAITTIGSLLGQWLLCRKILENWLLWLSVDVLYIGLYLQKGIPYHAFTAVIYCGLAIMGFLHWQSKMQKLVHETA